ncbi:UNKNOWN [Stylonychia lemnae]|uniref:Acyltransferase 3 domain-containing protein n=1 Tax=Stylonychia lemnae TaxID=5949 RepID=A0A078AUW6_STYLE|nr:UNKNOWN [Stylonychia lemnae]|eukprot:CDW85999.1 UNKNOWN [Stylonychia lemnae]
MIEDIYRNSGKDYNDLGRYEDCLNVTDFHYILASVPKAFPIPMSIGLCVPKICKTSDFNSYKTFLVAELNQIIPNVFEGIKGFDLNIKLKNDDMIFENSESKNDEITRANALSWFTVLLIFFFTMTVILSTFAAWYFHKEQERKIQEEKEKLAKRQEKKSKKKRNGNKADDQSEIKNRKRTLKYKENFAEEDKEQEDMVTNESARHKKSSSKKIKVIKNQEPTMMEKIIKCFSLWNSLEQLYKPRVSNDHRQFEIFNGLRVFCINWIILGNTFFYILKGPIQNMGIIQEFMSDFLFSLVLAADFIVDIFFYMTAFVSSYFLLIRLHQNYGSFGQWTQVMRLYLHRFMRLFPTYLFALFFYWKFLTLFGGEGPMFFMYSTQTECSRFWFWHITFLNNLIPFARDDTCMPWTWYLANDFQFYLLVPLFVHLYYNKRRIFYYVVGGIFFVSKIIQLSVILANDLSVSYFTYNDEYWTVYYVKPYSRIPVYLIGVILGCNYFSYKYESPDSFGIIPRFYKTLLDSKIKSTLFSIAGFVICLIIVMLMQLINNSPNNGSLAGNLFYLLLSRPLFIIGVFLQLMPMILGQPSFRTPRKFLSHKFWLPYSKLTYGAFLTHGMFMQFREYNTERGHWVSGYDTFLYYFAFVAFSYLFALLLAIVIEFPIASMYKEFIYQLPPTGNVSEIYNKQSSNNDEETLDYQRDAEKQVKINQDREERRRKQKDKEERLKILDDDDDDEIFDSNATISELVKPSDFKAIHTPNQSKRM